MRARFLISKYGDESGNCDHHSTTCAVKCLQNCCPMYKSEGEYEGSLGEVCEECKEEIHTAMEDHYVNDPESSFRGCKKLALLRARAFELLRTSS